MSLCLSFGAIACFLLLGTSFTRSRVCLSPTSPSQRQADPVTAVLGTVRAHGGPAVHPPSLSRQQVSFIQRLSLSPCWRWRGWELAANTRTSPWPWEPSALGPETGPPASVLSRALAGGSNPGRTAPLPALLWAAPSSLLPEATWALFERVGNFPR